MNTNQTAVTVYIDDGIPCYILFSVCSSVNDNDIPVAFDILKVLVFPWFSRLVSIPT